MKRLVLLITVLFLAGCDLVQDFQDSVLVTATPVEEVAVTFTPESTPVEKETIIFPTPSVTPCVFAGDCEIPTANPDWEYTVFEYHKIRCVAKAEDGSLLNCNVRSYPNLDDQYIDHTVPYGTLLDSTAVYHCEIFERCDKNIVEWYYLESRFFAAKLDSVWEEVKLNE